MVMLLIPTPAEEYPDVRVRVPLDGATYAVRWLWNTRDRVWTFSMWDADGAPLVMGVRVVVKAILNLWADATRGPPGLILVVDPTGKGGEPSLSTLGSQFKVVYASFEEAA